MTKGKKRILWGGVLLCLILAAIALWPRGTRTSFWLAEGEASRTQCHIIDSGRTGPTVLLLGGTHGDETAGFTAAGQLVDDLTPRTGLVILIPYANRQAIDLNQRTGADLVDMNRAYPGDPEGDAIQVLAAEIMALIQQYQPVCVVDMHEGRNFYGVDGSIGNSIVVGQTPSSFRHALDILAQVNANNGGYPDFALEGNAPLGSLNCTASRSLGIDAFTIETSKQLPLEVRVSQQRLIVRSILNQYGMKADLQP